jgi:hypothetical protein
MAGAGGAIQIRAELVPGLRFEILGTSVRLKKVSMLPTQFLRIEPAALSNIVDERPGQRYVNAPATKGFVQ